MQKKDVGIIFYFEKKTDPYNTETKTVIYNKN